MNQFKKTLLIATILSSSFSAFGAGPGDVGSVDQPVFTMQQHCALKKRQAILAEIGTAIGTYKVDYSQEDLMTNQKILTVLMNDKSIVGKAIIKSCK
jgi:hypothetical protein